MVFLLVVLLSIVQRGRHGHDEQIDSNSELQRRARETLFTTRGDTLWVAIYTYNRATEQEKLRRCEQVSVC